MVETTLCYIERNGKYLMLFRNKKKEDINAGKWIGVGGKLEPGETPDECLLREVKEETGLELTSYQKRGDILFRTEPDGEEIMMYLYTADGFRGTLSESCSEGELAWIPIPEVMDLALWEGDRIFLKDLVEGKQDINLELVYRGDQLVKTIVR